MLRAFVPGAGNASQTKLLKSNNIAWLSKQFVGGCFSSFQPSLRRLSQNVEEGSLSKVLWSSIAGSVRFRL